MTDTHQELGTSEGLIVMKPQHDHCILQFSFFLSSYFLHNVPSKQKIEKHNCISTSTPTAPIPTTTPTRQFASCMEQEYER